MRLILASVLILSGLPAFAADRCNVPKESWRPIDDLKSELTGKGWTIRNVKTDDGCYEVYGTDAAGKRMEVYFNPATFEAAGSDD